MKPTSIRLSQEIADKIEATGMKQSAFIIQAIEEKLGIKKKQSLDTLYSMLKAQEKRIDELQTQLSYLTIQQGSSVPVAAPTTQAPQVPQTYNKDRKQEVLDKLVSAIKDNPDENQKVKIAKIAGVSRGTTTKYWDEAQAIASKR